jgi:hypothetical protein
LIEDRPDWRRCGRFRIYNVRERLPEARAVLAGLVVLRTEPLYYEDAIEYTALGPDFAAVEDGAKVPHYHAVVICDERGRITSVSWSPLL